MSRLYMFGLVVAAIPFGAAALIACSEGDPHPPFVAPPDDAAAPEASLPPLEDAGLEPTDADAAPPDYDASDEPVVCTKTPCATQLAAGDRHFCALLSDGTVRCWGTDTRGSLGRGDTDGGIEAGAAPAPVVGITGATQISASIAGDTTCVRSAERHVQCWGDNSGALLGNESGDRDSAPHPTPSDVSLAAEVVRVDVGQATACALATSGDVYCWGSNYEEQLARVTPNTGYYGPGLADRRGHAITRVSLGRYSSFAVTQDGQVVGWGRISGRDSSLSSDDGSGIMVPLPGLSGVTDVATGGFASGGTPHECAIAAGSVYCWGGNLQGVLGTGVPDNERLPTRVGILTDRVAFPQRLALVPNRTCVRMTDGTIQCCGDDKLGQLGRGTPGNFASRFSPAKAFEERAVQVTTSTNTTCALVQDGKVVCWGGNANGELGQGTMDSEPHPTPVMVVFE